jgi:hypothetical protein
MADWRGDDVKHSPLHNSSTEDYNDSRKLVPGFGRPGAHARSSR